MAIQYRRLPLSMASTGINLLSDSIVATLHTTTYTPASSLDTDQFVSNLTGEVATGGGYTTGGQALTSKTLAYITAANWGKAWAASTAFTAGDLVNQGGWIYRCVTAGTSAGAAPTWPTTVGSTVTDGTITWYTEGAGSTAWTASTAYAAGYIVRPATQNGFLYRAAVAGTSNTTAPTWPTVVGQTVTDGGVTWECVGSGITVFAAANPSWSAATFTGVRYVVFSDRTPGTAATQPLLAYIDYGSSQAGQGGAFTIQLNPEGILFYLAP